ncbi:reverse transcriptase [Gossypium australe]|uniref:Reverse transcriptase n=1 Tax=Gossypium australe TaxID=47621 RepID=A0A5B6WIA8_9ROSI|nr:reverse transcriptase [Gossypium australe]
MLLILGFANSWVDFISHCMNLVSYSILINGREGKRFSPSKGLRQGDPLSPYLYLVCSEELSTLMQLAKDEGLIERVRVSRKGPQISHLLFVDDTVLFGEATDPLKKYEEASGQCVNYEKSTAFYSSNTTDQMRELVTQVLNVHVSKNSCLPFVIYTTRD